MLDPFRERHKRLSEVRIDLFEPAIRVTEYTTQRFRNLFNAIPFTLNRVSGGRWTKRFGPSVERDRYRLHITEEDRVLYHRRCVRYLCWGSRVSRKWLRIPWIVIIISIAVFVLPFTNAHACVIEPLKDARRAHVLDDPGHGVVQWKRRSIERRPNG